MKEIFYVRNWNTYQYLTTKGTWIRGTPTTYTVASFDSKEKAEAAFPKDTKCLVVSVSESTKE